MGRREVSVAHVLPSRTVKREEKSRWKCFEATLRAMYTSRHQSLDQVFLIDATVILIVNM